ncbi:MAG: hypothetical protein ACTILK_00305 [Bifidobacterium crudilactis]|uniref:hypothetical protein n=1 Tax=Bifidobacterium crudilactis TaxID=327277 RepID=UPI003F9B5E99
MTQTRRLLIALLAALALILPVTAAHADDMDATVTYEWDGPPEPTVTAEPQTETLYIGEETTFVESVDMAGDVQRHITTQPAQGSAWLASVHYSAHDAKPGTYPFVVTYSNQYGQTLDVTYTAIVLDRQAVADSSISKTLARTGTNPATMLAAATIALLTGTAAFALRQKQGRTRTK